MQAFESARMGNIKPSFETMLGLFMSCAIQFESVYVLIDAFDECSLNFQWSVLEAIRRLSLVSIRVLVTSRPHPEILQLQISEEEAFRIEIKAHKDDIQKYLIARLTENTLTQKVKDLIVEAVSQGAEGM